MPKAYKEGINQNFCFATDINKLIPLHSIQYTKDFPPVNNCDNSMSCKNYDCTFHNEHVTNVPLVNYLVKRK